MPLWPAAYSTATGNVVMGRVFKERSITLQVEGWDTLQVAIYRREGPP